MRFSFSVINKLNFSYENRINIWEMNTKTNLACETGGLVIEVLNKIYDDVFFNKYD